ncbi:hypothetical protein FQN50_001999 [Emmonsiellopsis sp. PD_5]|nr:hypothetical protein FQN50_001999 [Emmonsiellopsis sp. PD_5]
MRRIDLCCKLGGPLFIALLDGISTNIAILTTLGMNILSVFNTIPALRHPPTPSTPTSSPTPTTTSISSSETTTTTPPFLSKLPSLLPTLTFYLTHSAFLPSISLSLLYFTVLSFGGNMVAYLLSANYSSTNVGIIRTVAVVFEISATWIAPGVMSRVGPVRAGMWFLSWQVIWLTGGVVGFLRGGNNNDGGDDGGFLAASWLVVGVVASRVGLWGFDLCAQIIIQEEVSPPTRGTFSSIESSFQNTFELASFAATMIFSRPDQFRYPVLMSCGAIYIAGALYAAFVRRRRGHLLHFSRCVGEVKGKGRERGVDRDDGVERALLAGREEV